jgi:type VI protein secretion system component Hcp
MTSTVPRILFAPAFALAMIAATPAFSEPTAPAAGTIKGESTEVDHKDTISAQPTTCAALAAGPLKVASDPEEGGQIARTAKPKSTPKPQISELTVTKTSDKASANLAQAAPAAPARCGPAQH